MACTLNFLQYQTGGVVRCPLHNYFFCISFVRLG
ncbi:unnamed protein product, partial [Vitis vinifera]|uniref:Uncharacterized protein n=1 Tax=Vitis vinifera TaxID=29760 RepID=D7TC49_VITVI